MNPPLIYATRSFLPSATANAVQSAHMAETLDRHLPGTLAAYRTPRPGFLPGTHFGAFGLGAPQHCHPILCNPTLEHTHLYVIAFLRLFRTFTGSGIPVYTRSARLSWAAHQAGLPCVIELHDPLIPVRRRWLRRLFCEGKLPGIVATTSRLRDDIVEEVGLPSERILVAGGAACARHADVPAADRPQGGVFHVGYAGSAMPGKGIERVLACAELLPRFSFHLLGPSLAECARFGPLPKNVVYHGRLPPPEVMAVIKSMDALLLPNQRSVIIRSGADIGQHTSPLKLFEYLASGSPIVASDLPVFETILSHGRNALLCPPEDSAAFAGALQRLHDEPAVGKRLGAQAHQDFLNRHTWDIRTRSVLGFLRSVGVLSPTSISA